MSSTKSNINVKIDADVKEAAALLLSKMGLDQTTAIGLFYRQIISERRLPFQPEFALSGDSPEVSPPSKKNRRKSKSTQETVSCQDFSVDSEECPANS